MRKICSNSSGAALITYCSKFRKFRTASKQQKKPWKTQPVARSIETASLLGSGIRGESHSQLKRFTDEYYPILTFKK